MAPHDGQGEATDIVQGGDGALIVVDVPQAAATKGAGAAYGSQRHGARDRWTFGAACHGPTSSGQRTDRHQQAILAAHLSLQQGLPAWGVNYDYRQFSIANSYGQRPTTCSEL